MNSKHQQYYQQVNEITLTHLTPVLMNKLQGQVQLIEEARNSLSDYYLNMGQDESKVEVLEVVRKMKTLKEVLAKSVNGMSMIKEEADLDVDFCDYFEALNNYAETLPETLQEEQSPDRFVPFPNDSFRVKVGKRFKKWALTLGWIPTRLANWIRSKRGRQPVKLHLWQHHIPLRGMIIYHFRDVIVEQIIEMVQAINRAIAASTHELYTVEAGLDQKFAEMIGEEEIENVSITDPVTQEKTIEQILNKIRELQSSINEMTTNRLERIYEIFQLNYELVGTIELSAKNFEPAGLESAHRQAKKAYSKIMLGWHNTFSVLSDRYNFDHELFRTRFTNLEQYLFVSQKLDTRISEKILEEINKIAEFLEARQQQLGTTTGQIEDFKKLLKEIRFETSRYLKRAIPDSINLIREQNVPALIDGLEEKTKAQVAQLSEKRSMVKNINYEQAIKESDINNIAPRELITFEALPEYLKTIQTLKQEITEVVDATQQQLMEISNICDFNLETALAALDDESQHDKAKSMSIEGIDRAHSRVEDIIEGLKELAAQGDTVIHDGVGDFNQRIMAMNEIDQVYETQVRIAKAKAVEKTKQLRANLVGKLKKFIPLLITNLKRRGLMVYKRYRETSRRYGITETVKNLSAEVSGFLADTEKTVKNLPFVYQRLFEIAPLDNLYFYESRQMATLSLRKAYENWETGHFGATSLVGESGSGVTTLVYFFLRDLNSGLPVIHLKAPAQIYTSDALFKFLNQELQTDTIKDTDSLIKFMNGLKGKHIVVLDDMEHFFLRKVNGFECIKVFIELISRTNKNIFWLATIDEYTYNYLVKTVHLNEYFSTNVTMRPLKPDQVTSLVLKRHRVSGFSTVFRPDKQDRKNKKFQKMSEEEQQDYLKKEYFNALNRIAQSNITVALVFWLRSIKEIQDDVMMIRSIKGIEFTFLMNLSDEKLYTLHAMLLHDGISINDHTKIFQQTNKESEFLVLALFDDGIIELRDGLYFINPLLYRQVVNLLKAKNILH